MAKRESLSPDGSAHGADGSQPPAHGPRGDAACATHTRTRARSHGQAVRSFPQPASRCVRTARPLTRPHGPAHPSPRPVVAPQPRPTHLTSSMTGKALAAGGENWTRTCRHSGGAAESPARRWTFTRSRRSTNTVSFAPSPCRRTEKAQHGGQGVEFALGKYRRHKALVQPRGPGRGCARGAVLAGLCSRGCAHRAVFLPELHGHGRPQLLGAERPPARAAVQGQREHRVHLGAQSATQVVTPAAPRLPPTPLWSWWGGTAVGQTQVCG